MTLPPLLSSRRLRSLRFVFRMLFSKTLLSKFHSESHSNKSLNGNLGHQISICRCKCFGDPTPPKLSLTIEAVQLEPFTVADNGSSFNRGIEIHLIELIAKKMNIELHYAINHSSYCG